MDRQIIKKSIELIIHLLLVIAVPFIYLEIATGFNKYRLPEYMPVVYIYWLVYILISAVVYGVLHQRKRYQRPDCTKKHS